MESLCIAKVYKMCQNMKIQFHIAIKMLKKHLFKKELYSEKNFNSRR